MFLSRTPHVERFLQTQPDGRLADASAHSDDGFSTFFSETGNGKHVPRSLYVSTGDDGLCVIIRISASDPDVG